MADQEPPRAAALADALGRGHDCYMQDRHDDALAAFDEALKLASEAGNKHSQASAQLGRGTVLRALSRHEEALAAFNDALKLARESGDKLGQANAQDGRGEVLRALSRHEEALAAFDDALKLAREADNKLGQANAQQGRGEVLRALSRRDEAIAAFDNALKLARDAGDKHAEANTSIGRGQTLEAMGKWEDAHADYVGAREIGDRLRYGYAIVMANAGLRRVETARQGTARGPSSTESPHITAWDAFPHRLREIRNALQSECPGSPHVLAEIDGLTKDLEIDRCRRVYGAERAREVPSTPHGRAAWLESMLPSGPLWCAVLICDIRGFTTAMAHESREEQVRILNAFLTRTTALIRSRGGGVDKYMGDAVLAFFLPGENGENPSEAERARVVNSALDAACDIATDSQVARIFADLNACYAGCNAGVGVGVTCGDASFGVVGAPDRQEYTLIGPPVNLAARVQGVALPGEALATVRVTQHARQHPRQPGDGTFAFVTAHDDAHKKKIKDKMKGFADSNLVLVTRIDPGAAAKNPSAGAVADELAPQAPIQPGSAPMAAGKPAEYAPEKPAKKAATKRAKGKGKQKGERKTGKKR